MHSSYVANPIIPKSVTGMMKRLTTKHFKPRLSPVVSWDKSHSRLAQVNGIQNFLSKGIVDITHCSGLFSGTVSREVNEGHFDGTLIVPGVLLASFMAQAYQVLLEVLTEAGLPISTQIPSSLGLQDIQFFKPVYPEEPLQCYIALYVTPDPVSVCGIATLTTADNELRASGRIVHSSSQPSDPLAGKDYPASKVMTVRHMRDLFPHGERWFFLGDTTINTEEHFGCGKAIISSALCPDGTAPFTLAAEIMAQAMLAVICGIQPPPENAGKMQVAFVEIERLTTLSLPVDEPITFFVQHHSRTDHHQATTHRASASLSHKGICIATGTVSGRGR